MKNTFLVVTSIADQEHPVLNQLAKESSICNIPFLVIGDTKSPKDFNIRGCDFYSIERQKELDFELVNFLPEKHYARKNIGYLIAMKHGADIIIETDDDNIPYAGFWEQRNNQVITHLIKDMDWVNIYRYFTDRNIWPRGYALEKLQENLPEKGKEQLLDCPIQQGLANENPDIDAIYRLTMPLPVYFEKANNVALGNNSVCPFNSQNTTWFKEAFLLMYLPSYCSFRMTDIWRSFVAQRIAWTCGWPILFHQATVWQERNDHNLMIDFNDEIPGYLNNGRICKSLKDLNLKIGIENIPDNMRTCYQELIKMELVAPDEMNLLNCWINDVTKCVKN